MFKFLPLVVLAVLFCGLAAVPAQAQEPEPAAVATGGDIVSQLQEIEIVRGMLNVFQLFIILLVLVAVWMFYGPQIKEWYENSGIAGGIKGGGGSSGKGVEAVYKTLRENNFTAEEASSFVQENCAKILTGQAERIEVAIAKTPAAT